MWWDLAHSQSRFRSRNSPAVPALPHIGGIFAARASMSGVGACSASRQGSFAGTRSMVSMVIVCSLRRSVLLIGLS